MLEIFFDSFSVPVAIQVPVTSSFNIITSPSVIPSPINSTVTPTTVTPSPSVIPIDPSVIPPVTISSSKLRPMLVDGFGPPRPEPCHDS